MPASVIVKIDSKGRWLHAAAAASYLRMVAASGGLTGLVSAGRTRAQQLRLYFGWIKRLAGFNMAAYRSFHESGLAIDVQTGSPLQRWMTKGSRYDRVTSSGTTQAADFGWLRTVPSEPWHFQYFAAKDKHRNDKPKPVVVKPPVVVVPPVVIPPKPSVIPTLARVATLNCHGWNLPRSAWTARAEASLIGEVKRLGCSIYALTECPEYMRDGLRAGMPGGSARWRVVTRGDQFHQAILFDSHKWKIDNWQGHEFGPTSYHGGVWATFVQTVTRATLAVGSYHLPPNVVSSGSDQERYLRSFLIKAPKVAVRIAGGDGADASSWAGAWQDARIIAATSSNRAACTYKASIKDRIHMLGAVVRRYSVGPIIADLDHRSVLAQITIPGTIHTSSSL